MLPSAIIGGVVSLVVVLLLIIITIVLVIYLCTRHGFFGIRNNNIENEYDLQDVTPAPPPVEEMPSRLQVKTNVAYDYNITI